MEPELIKAATEPHLHKLTSEFGWIEELVVNREFLLMFIIQTQDSHWVNDKMSQCQSDPGSNDSYSCDI